MAKLEEHDQHEPKTPEIEQWRVEDLERYIKAKKGRVYRAPRKPAEITRSAASWIEVFILFLKASGSLPAFLSELWWQRRQERQRDPTNQTHQQRVDDAMTGLARASDLLTPQLRKTLKKFVADEHAEILELLNDSRPRTVAYRIWMARVIWAAYILKAPVIWIVRAVVGKWMAG